MKKVVLDEKERLLCHNCKWRYCPTYECGLLDKVKSLTDKQWDNSQVKKHLRRTAGNLGKTCHLT